MYICILMIYTLLQIKQTSEVLEKIEMKERKD